MVERLRVEDGDLILEPSAGDGLFIEKLLSLSEGKSVTIHAIDVNPEAISTLQSKFQVPAVNIRLADTLLDLTLDLFVAANGHYSRILGNPPYGAWQDHQRRHLLKRRYGGYVRETYTLFLRRCVELLVPNGRLVFIVPDTFLALHAHTGLRRYLLQNTLIEEITLIPSKFFPGVNFGYSNLCIITLVKSPVTKSHKMKIVAVNKQVDDLYAIASGDYSVATDFRLAQQSEILDSEGHSFLVGGDERMRSIVKNSTQTLGDIADCVTGFYSGNNREFLAIAKDANRKPNGYVSIDTDFVESELPPNCNLLDGLRNGKTYIPIVKGANGVIVGKTEWFVRWDALSVKLYKHDKKARFQNSQFYFREGIAIPMVRSSRLRAFLLERRLFDQSIVGVFPKSPDDLNVLLAFLNSSTCSKLLKLINHTANNSANYIKKIPIVWNQSVRGQIDSILETFFETHNAELCLREIDSVFDACYNS